MAHLSSTLLSFSLFFAYLVCPSSREYHVSVLSEHRRTLLVVMSLLLATLLALLATVAPESLQCELVCRLANSVVLHATRNDTACSFCIDSRSTHSNCFDNVIDCAYRDPRGLIFCTNFYETKPGGEFVTRQTRCISYYDELIEDAEIRGIADNGHCEYKDRQYCDCPKVCPGRNVSNDGWPNDMPTTPAPPVYKNMKQQFPHKEIRASTTPKPTAAPSKLVEEKPAAEVSFLAKAELKIRDWWGSIITPNDSHRPVHFAPLLVSLIFTLLAF